MASRTLSLALYNTLLPAGLLYMAPAALVKMRRRGGSWSDFSERLGFPSGERLCALEKLPRMDLIWMHAVSVGEIGVARKLIAEMLKQSPDQAVVLTTTTPTGHRLAMEVERLHAGRVVAFYSPLDIPFVMKRVMDEWQPSQIILVEAEVWPNMLNEARRRSIPVSLVNARLSPRSGRRFARFRGIMGPIFEMLHRVCVQEPEDVERWQTLGVPRERILRTGSIKYDPQGAAASATMVEKLAGLLRGCGLAGRPLLLAASTHAGEEAALARVYLEMKSRHPSLGFLVVPRHFERGVAVVEELRALGVESVRRSQVETQPVMTDVLIVDSTGELKAWQALATIVIVGKSFLAEGGQNPAEAVMAGKPVVFGPHMENFEPLVRLLLSEKGAVQVPSLISLTEVLDGLLCSPEKCKTLAQAGRNALLKHQGATQRTAHLVISKFEKSINWD